MKENNYPGKFIAFEGLDGSGQSTQAELLRKFLIKKGKKVLKTKEPTLDSEAGKEIRAVLNKKKKVSPMELQKLFVKDREKHLNEVIIPALKEGKVVISDRYFFSTFAFGAADGLDLETLIKLNNDFLLPDLTIFLKVSPQVCINRIIKRGEERTLFEKKKKLRKVWEVYKVLAKRFKNVKVVDGEKSIGRVAKEIERIVCSRLNL